jgi:[ribosomal protein S5]-alanine N-acetyltransferase
MEIKPIAMNIDKSEEMYSSEDCQMLLKMYEEYYPTIGYHSPWIGYFIIKENQIVGCCGFKGQPNDGKVEISYWTFQAFEKQGVASFSCRELVSIAQQFDPTVIITATTLPEHNASTKILQNNGFEFTEIVQDDEIGDAWLWVLKD